MKFETPLIEGILLKRYKRFLADVQLRGKNTIVAHVPNSGSMLGVSGPGSLCRVSISTNPNRKLAHTLEMVRGAEGCWVGVNTSLTNRLVSEAFQQKRVADWIKFNEITSEIKISEESRLDFLLSSPQVRRYVEVKNVSMAKPPFAVFPDAPTVRGQKHLRDLADLVKKGSEAEIFFVVQREDCSMFRPCDEIDPEYGKLLRKVTKENVKISCWSCRIREGEIELDKPLMVNLD